MAFPHSRHGAAPPAGVIVAAVVALVIVIGIALVAALSGGPNNANATEDELPPAPDITDIPTETSARGMYIQLVDRDDPNRVAGEIRAESFEPIDPSNRNVVEPRATFFLDDGRTAYIEANEGRFFIPPGTNQPEEGVLRGDVRVRLFAAKPDGSRPDPDTDESMLDATFDQPLRFDMRLGEISTRGRMEVIGDQMEFAGTDVRAVINQTRQRITLLEVERGERLIYKPGAEAPIARIPTRFPASRASTSNGRGPAFVHVQSNEPDGPAIDLYRAEFADGVVAQQLGRRITADRLEVWVRLFDRQLAPRETRSADTGAPRSWSGSLTDLVVAAALAQAQPQDDPLDSEANAPITLTWTGRLRVDSLDETSPPPQLEDENLAMRFTAPESVLVEFGDEQTGTQGVAVAAEYYDSAQTLTLSGIGAVRVEAPDAGSIEGVNQMTVALDVGNVNVRGPGVLYTSDHQGDNPDTGRRRSISWTDQADFEFIVEDGRMTDRLDEARFIGRVLARADDAELRGSDLVATFVPEPTEFNDDSGQTPRLSLLRVSDADATDGRGGSLRGETMRVWFDPESEDNDSDPTRVYVEGSVRGVRDDGSYIEAQVLDAELETEPSGRIVVHTVSAEQDVRFADGRDIVAESEALSAVLSREFATLTGENAFVRRGPSTISGPQIDLDGVSRVLRVQGAGTLSDTRRASRTEPARTLNLAWSDFMTFEDVRGDALVVGDVDGTLESINETGILAVDRVTADRIRVELDPADPSSETPDDGSMGDRVREITVFASSLEPDAIAQVEARRYAPTITPGAKGDLLRVIALEGREIKLLAPEERVVVPGPGRLVSLQTAEAAALEGETSDSGPETDAARVLVEWIGGMQLRQREGTADLYNQVAVVHYRPDEDVTTELETEHLSLTYRQPEGGGGELVAIDANGAAWLRSGAREMLADHVLYNADTGLARASARTGNTVTLFEGQRGTPIRAAELEWDLLRDRVTVTRPAGAATPR